MAPISIFDRKLQRRSPSCVYSSNREAPAEDHWRYLCSLSLGDRAIAGVVAAGIAAAYIATADVAAAAVAAAAAAGGGATSGATAAEGGRGLLVGTEAIGPGRWWIVGI